MKLPEQIVDLIDRISTLWHWPVTLLEHHMSDKTMTWNSRDEGASRPRELLVEEQREYLRGHRTREQLKEAERRYEEKVGTRLRQPA
jgi:hypothetical protein